MARILLSFCQVKLGDTYNDLACFYDSFSQELKNCGNEVLLLNLSAYKSDYFSSNVRNKNFLLEQVKNFNPELIIAFNNQIFDGLLENTDCPIAIFDADDYDLFSCKKLLKENIARYTMLTFCESWIEKYQEVGFSKDKIHYIPPATSIIRENLIQDKNISFIGTFFWHSFTAYNNFSQNDSGREFYDLYLNFLKTHDYDYRRQGSKKLLKLTEGLSDVDLHLFYDIRNITLVNILDLGLNLYGVGWNMSKRFIPQLFLAFDSKPVYSLAHNQNIYNSSKIGLSISHPQNKGNAFPWRIFDVMGSNACLVSSYSKQLIDETKGWVDIPMFHTPQEARELCVKLLKEENYRKDIVEASQKYIEKNARWDLRFKKMEEIFNLKIITDEKTGQISFPFISEEKVDSGFCLINLLKRKFDFSKESDQDILNVRTMFNDILAQIRIKRHRE